LHNGECLRTVILSNSPPLSQGRFAKNADVGLFASLNSTVSLFNIKTGKLLREYTGHENNDYIVELGFTHDAHDDICGFVVGSENGRVFKYHLLQGSPVDSLEIASDSSAIDLVLTNKDAVFVCGRTQNVVHKVLY
jgi:WD40 repeat protein